MNQIANKDHSSTKDEEPQNKLLKQFLEMSVEQRPNHFADTSTVANLVGRSSRTIELWISQGYISAVRVGGRYEVLLQSVHDYLRQCASE